MKRYIRSDMNRRLEESRRKVAKLEKQVNDSNIYMPTLKAIKSRYSQITGFLPEIRKCYYRADINAVLATIDQWYNDGYTTLLKYDSPKSISPRSPLMIYVDDESSIERAVNMMVSKLESCISGSFDSVYNFSYESVPAFGDYVTLEDQAKEDYQVAKILYQAHVANEQDAENFIYSLLDSGKVVNHLPELLDDPYVQQKRG